MTEPHLVHRLPWNTLATVLKSNRPRSGYSYATRNALIEKHRKSIEHFARCLTDALKEFAASDRSTDDERAEFDPWRTWLADRVGGGGNMGYMISIIYGYIELNLILTDPIKLPPLVCQDEDLRSTWTMDVLCDRSDGGHPEWLASHLTPVFDEKGRLKPMTPDVLQRIRDHCALLFRCMHTLSDRNSFLDPASVASDIMRYTFQC